MADPDRLYFGGYLVDGTQPKTPLLFGLDPRGQPPAMDEQRRLLWTKGSPPQICSLLVALAR